MPATLRPREQAVLRAYAQALIPAGGGLPGGEEVEIVAPLAGALGRTSPRLRLAIRLVIAAFEWTSFPRRFTRLSPAARADHLIALAGQKGVGHLLFSTLKSFVLLAYGNDPAAWGAVGVMPRCVADDARTSAPGLDREQLRAPAEEESCDVVVVGSGAGGAAAARVLAESSLDVIVVEEGEYHNAADYTTDTFDSTATLYRDGGLTVCEGQPAIPMPIGRCVGGTTVINSGTCFRCPDDVLLDWRDRFGIDWATQLERDFEQLERDLDVAPVDPASAGRNAEICRAGADAIGASNGPITRNAGRVSCCGTCPNGCAIDAKRAMHVSELPRAVAAGARIRAGAEVDEILFEGTRAAGVACTTASGRYKVRARAVVLAAGAIGTPRLLLAQGVSDLSGQIGRNLRIHPACWVGARYEEPVRGWDGVMQSWYVDEWRDRGLFLEATFTPFAFGLHWLPGSGEELRSRIERYDHLAIIGVHMSDHGSSGRVTPTRSGHARISYRLDSADAREIAFGIARASEMHLAAGAREVYPQIAGLSTIRSHDQLARLEQSAPRANELRLEAFHPMGTVRMGAERASSVISPTGESHELTNLFVADASIFPTSLGVNPMITIMACARHVAREVAEKLS